MINENRVKELYHMAVYDTRRDKADQQTGQYFMWDYISKEMIKSFFTGTIAYLLLALMWGMSNLERVMFLINNLDVGNLSVSLIVLYVGFMAIYLFVTVIVYGVRYTAGNRRLKNYEAHMNKVRKLYQQEERLKS